MSEDKSQKTEEPTEKKKSDQRKKGNVPSSREVGVFFAVASLAAVAAYILPTSGAKIVSAFVNAIDQAPLWVSHASSFGMKEVAIFAKSMFSDIIVEMLKIFALMIAASVASVFLQGEVVLASERLKPKWSNISLISGFKKIVSVNNLVEFSKSLIKVFVVVLIAFFVAKSALSGVIGVPGVDPQQLGGYIIKASVKILMLVAVFLAVLSVIDVIWKRFQWINQNKMTLKEVRDEFKDAEGDPHMKAKLREKRIAMSRNRVSQAVPKASVILTNPTHYAVALKYDQGVDQAPVCVAKGVDNMAKTIREIAAEHDIPIIENRPLARSLYAEVDVDRVIPDKHWQAVAEIISFVFQLRNNAQVRPPEGSRLRDEQDEIDE